MSSEAQPFDPAVPYDGLPLLPPREDVENHAILKACIDARVALAELNMAGRLVPNQAILINTIPILEARASSEIENIVTTTSISRSCPTSACSTRSRSAEKSYSFIRN